MVLTLIIRCSLVLFGVALASFALAFALDVPAMAGLAGLLAHTGVFSLLSAFALLSASGLCLLIKLSLHAVCDYFSPNRRLERKLLFNLSRWDLHNRRHYFKKAKIAYLNRQQRRKLFEKSGRKTEINKPDRRILAYFCFAAPNPDTKPKLND